MARFILTDAKVSIDGVDLSDRVRSVAVSTSSDLQEASTMGEGNVVRLNGLTDFSFEVGFAQDFDSGKVDDTLFPLVGADPFEVRVQPVKSQAISSTNPEFVGSCVLGNYEPLNGNVGELSETTVTFTASQSTFVTRNTS